VIIVREEDKGGGKWARCSHGSFDVHISVSFFFPSPAMCQAGGECRFCVSVEEGSYRCG